MNALRSAYNRMAETPKINPNDPRQLSKVRGQVGSMTNGRFDVKTIPQAASGMGIYGDIDPGGYGYTIVQSEREKQRYNPNSEEFKRESARRRQEAIDEEMRRKARMQKI